MEGSQNNRRKQKGFLESRKHTDKQEFTHVYKWPETDAKQ